jgi:hypothetical protein
VELKQLSFDASLDQYLNQAEGLLAALRSGDKRATQVFHNNHPLFLDSKITWLAKNIPDSEIQSSPLHLADAQLAIARWYSFQDSQALAAYVEAVIQPGSPGFQYEAAAEAVITGDLAALEMLLRENLDLVRARSTRVTHHDPPVHRATRCITSPPTV